MSVFQKAIDTLRDSDPLTIVIIVLLFILFTFIRRFMLRLNIGAVSDSNVYALAKHVINVIWSLLGLVILIYGLLRFVLIILPPPPLSPPAPALPPSVLPPIITP